MSSSYYAKVAALAAQYDAASHSAIYLSYLSDEAIVLEQLESANFTPSNRVILEANLAKKKPKSNPDMPTFEEVMSIPDVDLRQEWITAMEAEIRALELKGAWIEVDCSQANGNILPLQWALKIKRYPDGTEKKKKARIVVRGDLERKVQDTFSPVVGWATVRLFFFVCLIFNLVTVGVDFSNAFVQAALKEPVWVHFPRGFRSETGQQNRCLKLLKSVYGLGVAPSLWSSLLFSALRDLGFQHSTIDSCLMFKGDMMLIVWVDDLVFGARSATAIDNVIQALEDRGFEMTRDGTVEEFLGIQIDRNHDNRTLTLKQPGLIERVIEATGLSNCNGNHVPAAPKALGSDPEGVPFAESSHIFDYASVVGMLMYLASNTRPDIAFAVSQVARFTHSAKASHGTAVKMIVRYLKSTQDKGLIVTPDGTLNLDCYCDADFAGLHGVEPVDNVVSAKCKASTTL